MKDLEVLDLRETDVTEGGVKSLQDALPDLEKLSARAGVGESSIQ